MSLILLEGDKKFININGINYEVIKEFPVMHIGWELDYRGFVVNCDGENRIVLLDHGKPYFVDRETMVNLLDKYGKVISETNEALGMIERI